MSGNKQSQDQDYRLVPSSLTEGVKWTSSAPGIRTNTVSINSTSSRQTEALPFLSELAELLTNKISANKCIVSIVNP